MKKIYIKYLVLIVILFLQGIVFLSFSNKEEEFHNKYSVDVSNEYKDKNINDIFNYFNNIKGAEINSINNEEDFSMEVTMKGNKNRIVKFLKEIEDYNVINYNINYMDEKFCLKVTVLGYKNL
ncbi:hypothetical protein ACFO6R_06640 [Eubacterium multiforme]|uniref:Uncharacterized protein n=1 Tax=Eubacterium multiforme TaxID=83339 RepID=A0ABT9USH9_9FIRM|nr:hypothetical protein [Eubacterium multiforme]MDQ0149272.1 hypothetical protein [Eubacterium multiforme]